MFKDIVKDYRSIRAFQICTMFVATLAIQRWLQYSHAAWIGFSVMMINAGFDSGTSLHRTQHRFWGAMLGLLLSYLLWFVIRIHYELIFLIIPFLVFMAFYFMGKLYAAPTIFTVTLTALGVTYYSPTDYHVSEFFFDYGRSTLFALFICVFFEYFVFKKSRLTHQFYFDLQRALIQELEQLFQVAISFPFRESQYLKRCAHLNTSVVAFHAFFSTIKYDYHVQEKDFEDFDPFCVLVEETYQNIRQLFVLRKQAQEQLELKADTNTRLGRLLQISLEHRSTYV